MRRLVLVLLLVAACQQTAQTACAPQPAVFGCFGGVVDSDGDGYSPDTADPAERDCDDSNADVNPGITGDLCDGLDNDCSGLVDDYLDEDGDSYWVYDAELCEDGDDCNDRDSRVNPGADEACDGLDNDCDGIVDEGCDDGPPLKLAIPGYRYPGVDWTPYPAAAESIGWFVANVDSGPGAVEDPEYTAGVPYLQNAGIAVLGYVSTAYGDRPAADVDAEVATWFARYGVDGVFFDEAPGTTTCADEQAWYEARAAAARADDPDALVVLNPGTATCEAYLDFADVLVLNEDHAGDALGWSGPPWLPDHPPRRFARLVHNASVDQMRTILADSRGVVGLVYVTDDTLPNPWDQLPSYWDELLEEL